MLPSISLRKTTNYLGRWNILFTDNPSHMLSTSPDSELHYVWTESDERFHVIDGSTNEFLTSSPLSSWSELINWLINYYSAPGNTPHTRATDKTYYFNYALSSRIPLMEEYFTSTKSYSNYPCAHRQYRHDGNCALIHGYSRSFRFEFAVSTLTKEGFVVDYGDLGELKDHLDYMYDHTLVLDEEDPEMETFRELESKGVCAIRTHPYGPGMEGTAHYLCEWADAWLRKKTNGRAWVISVEARENDKNSSIYKNPNVGFQGWR